MTIPADVMGCYCMLLAANRQISDDNVWLACTSSEPTVMHYNLVQSVSH